jgi:hypothetical protein
MQEPQQFEFTQVMTASEMSYLVDTPDYYSMPHGQTPVEDKVFIVVPAVILVMIFGYDYHDFEGVTLPANRPDDLLLVDNKNGFSPKMPDFSSNL